jgi:hypothetical protein
LTTSLTSSFELGSPIQYIYAHHLKRTLHEVHYARHVAVARTIVGFSDLEWLMIDSTIVRAHQHAADLEQHEHLVAGVHMMNLCRDRLFDRIVCGAYGPN